MGQRQSGYNSVYRLLWNSSVSIHHLLIIIDSDLYCFLLQELECSNFENSIINNGRMGTRNSTNDEGVREHYRK